MKNELMFIMRKKAVSDIYNDDNDEGLLMRTMSTQTLLAFH